MPYFEADANRTWRISGQIPAEKRVRTKSGPAHGRMKENEAGNGVENAAEDDGTGEGGRRCAPAPIGEGGARKAGKRKQ